MKKIATMFGALLCCFLAAPATGDILDEDWNLAFFNSCGLPAADSLQWRAEDGNRFVRFTLDNKDIGKCSTDAKPRHSAPYWERAELSQASRLERNTRYELSFMIRFVEGFRGKRESFWQVHAHNAPCWAYPPIMLKFSDGQMTLNALRDNGRRGSHSVNFSSIAIGDLIGRWAPVRMVFDTSGEPEVSLSIDGKEVFSNIPFWIEECGVPYFRFGIYRPGSYSGNKRSVVDYDAIRLTATAPDG